jgi:hypothetical protein
LRRISDIVQNKIECIKKRINGIIPVQNYSVAGTFSSEDDKEIISAIDEYDVQNPLRAFDDVYNFQITVDKVKNMKWYVELEDNMKKWRKLKEAEDGIVLQRILTCLVVVVRGKQIDFFWPMRVELK